MKMRIKANSLRLRISRSEVERFLRGDVIEESIRFSPQPGNELRYVLERAADGASTGVAFENSRIAVSVSHADLQQFAQDEQVGIYATLDIGIASPFELVIEKDFACLDRSAEDNEDTFPNPHRSADCRVAP
jgi:hypothetical protein